MSPILDLILLIFLIGQHLILLFTRNCSVEIGLSIRTASLEKVSLYTSPVIGLSLQFIAILYDLSVVPFGLVLGLPNSILQETVLPQDMSGREVDPGKLGYSTSCFGGKTDPSFSRAFTAPIHDSSN